MKATILVDNNTRSELIPEWGLSVFIDYNGHKVLLDTGDSGVFAENAKMLGIDLSEVEFGVLSHAHYDHSDGLAAFFAQNRTAPFYIRKGAGENCYSGNDGYMKYIGIRRGYLEVFADRIRYADGDLEVIPGVTLLPHKMPGMLEAGKRAKMYVKKGTEFEVDSFSHEQSLVFDTEKGLVVFNSCSHGGADAIIRETKLTWPDKPIYALIGGLHLFRSSDEEVRAMAERIRQTGIRKIYTGHCTGEHAISLLQEELGGVVESIYTGMEFTL